MANTLQFKRGNGAPGVGILNLAEPAFDQDNNLLYIGTDAGEAQIIGGASYVDRVDEFLQAAGNLSVTGTATVGAIVMSPGGTLTGLDDLSVSTLEATTEFTLNGTTITGIDNDIALGGGSASDDVVPTQLAVRTYVEGIVAGDISAITQAIDADNGGPTNLSVGSDTLTIAGGSNVQTTVSGQTITVDLEDDINVTSVETDGLTVDGVSQLNGNVNIVGDLTVTGATQKVNFEVRDVAISDRVLELGTEAGGAAPSAQTNYDLGVALNYHDGTSAKKAGFVWQDNTGFNLAAELTEGGDADSPDITASALADLGVNGIFIGDVTGGLANQVIDSTKAASLNEIYVGGNIGEAGNKFASFNGSQVVLENTAFDGGTY